MIESFDGITLMVKDIEKQKEFYEKVLGLKLISDYGSAVFFEIGGKKLGLFTREHHKEGTESLEGANKGISHMEFGISQKDLGDTEKKLKDKGFHAYGDNYKDADGNLFHFNINGGISF